MSSFDSLPLMQANAQLLQDTSNQFMGAYDMENSKLYDTVMKCISTVAMDSRQHRFFYYKSIPLPEYIPYNADVSFGTRETASFLINARKYGRALAWSEDDQEDDQTKSIAKEGADFGATMKNLPVRIFFQMIQGVANSALLGAAASIPDSPDGVDIFSATDGSGAARFGATGGNIISKTGVSGAAITDDFLSGMARVRSFLHTDGAAGIGTPLLSPDEMDEVVIFYPTAMVPGMAEAFIRTRVANSSSVFEGSNVIQESGYTIRLEPTSYLTSTTEWYMFFPKVKTKAIVMGTRGGLHTRMFNSANSAELAISFKSFFMAWERQGYASNIPFAALKVA